MSHQLTDKEINDNATYVIKLIDADVASRPAWFTAAGHPRAAYDWEGSLVDLHTFVDANEYLLRMAERPINKKFGPLGSARWNAAVNAIQSMVSRKLIARLIERDEAKPKKQQEEELHALQAAIRARNRAYEILQAQKKRKR